jgi:hypothetical protein
MKKNMKLSEPIPLGGGEFAFDPVKSGGELKIMNASSGGYLRMNWTSESEPGNPDHYFSLINFSYSPVNNFWQNQGYTWINGTVYVKNTERNLSTPLQFTSEENVTYGLARSLVDLEYASNFTSPGNCSSLTVRVVTMVPDSHHFRVSGNGNAMLALESNRTPEPIVKAKATSLNFTISRRYPEQFNATLWNYMNATAETICANCKNVERPSIDSAQHEIRLIFKNDPGYPSLIIETTDITIGAY